ncbi:MAG: mechanosensitive ion channel family protein [Bacteroidia bacterium]|nr:mechanosensitive ion channel family protein [Bacteroidia bacterium]
MFSHIDTTIGKLLINGLFIASILTLRAVVLHLYRRRKNIVNGLDNFIVGINTISLIIILVLLFFAFLQLVNIEIKHFFTSISIIAAAIAILSKDYISNAINGMTLMFNTNIEIGDYVKIDEQKGKIINLSLMNVQLKSEEGDLVLIPNNLVLNHQIVNYTKGDTRKAQVELPLPIIMFEDIEKTERVFKETISEFNHKANLNSFNVRIVDIQKDVVTVRLSIILHETDWEIDKEIRKKWINKWALLKQQLEK